MKRILIAAAIIIGMNHAASAQTSGSGASTNAPSVSSSRTKAKGTKAKKSQSQKSQSDSLNQRKMYKGENGQRATPTGHEATGTNGTAAPLPKKASTDTTRREE